MRTKLQVLYMADFAECEHIIEFHPQYLNNPETVTSTVESEHDKTNTMICRPSEFYYQPVHPQTRTKVAKD